MGLGWAKGSQWSVCGTVRHSQSFLWGDTWGPVPKIDNGVWLLPLALHRAHGYHVCNLEEPLVPGPHSGRMQWNVCVDCRGGAGHPPWSLRGIEAVFLWHFLPDHSPDSHSTRAHMHAPPTPPGTEFLCGLDSPGSSGNLLNKQTFLYGVVDLLATGKKAEEGQKAQKEEVAASHSRGFESTGNAS